MQEPSLLLWLWSLLLRLCVEAVLWGSNIACTVGIEVHHQCGLLELLYCWALTCEGAKEALRTPISLLLLR